MIRTSHLPSFLLEHLGQCSGHGNCLILRVTAFARTYSRQLHGPAEYHLAFSSAAPLNQTSILKGLLGNRRREPEICTL